MKKLNINTLRWVLLSINGFLLVYIIARLIDIFEVSATTVFMGLQTLFAGALLWVIVRQTGIIEKQTHIMERQNEITDAQSEISDYIGDFEYARFLLLKRLPAYQEKKKDLEGEMAVKKERQSGRLHPSDFKELLEIEAQISMMQATLSDLNLRGQIHFNRSKNRVLSRLDAQGRERYEEMLKNMTYEAFSGHRALIKERDKARKAHEKAEKRVSEKASKRPNGVTEM